MFIYFLLGGFVFVYFGQEFHTKTYKALKAKYLSMEVLISMGSSIAYLAGIF